MAAAIIALLVSLEQRIGPSLYINVTPSEPRGIYYLKAHITTAYARGMFVIFPVPREYQALVYGRGWLAAGVPLLKEIQALGSDEVCILDRTLTINGRVMGSVFTSDSQGLALPKRRGCEVLDRDSFFAVSTHLGRSFDSRYFGPQPLAQITGEAVPLWTY